MSEHDPQWFALVRAAPCAACGTQQWAREVQHVTGLGLRGKSQKSPSCWVWAACRRCHNRYHQLGAKTFGERYGTDIELVEKTRQAIHSVYPLYPLPELTPLGQDIPAPTFGTWKPKAAAQRPSSDTDTHLTPEQAAVSP